MGNLKKTGGERVGKGTYWNFRTEEKVVMEKEGILPGNATDSYFRLHPLLLIAMVTIPSLSILGFFPQFARRLFESQTEAIIIGYYTVAYIFMGFILITLALLAFGSILSRTGKLAAFGWRPSTAYLSSTEGSVNVKGEKIGKKDEENVKN